MYAIYKSTKYSAELSGDEEKVTLHSRIQNDGFEVYISKVSGRVFDGHFIKKVQMDDLDYLYTIRYEIQYKGHFFPVSSAMNRMNVKDDWFEIKPGLKQGQLGIDLGFKQINKMEWAKELHRSDIEKLKVIEEPLGIFINQGLKITIYEDGDIDTFLNAL